MERSELRKRLTRACANAAGFLVVMAILDLFTDFRWVTAFVVALFVGVIEFFRAGKKPVPANPPAEDARP